MRKEYTRALRKKFTQLVQEHFPDFSVFTEKSPYISPGAVVFVNRLHDDLWLFIELSGMSSEEGGFVLQVGWSRLHRFPQLPMSPNFFICDSEDEIIKDEGFTRLRNPDLQNEEVFYVAGTERNSLSSLRPSAFKMTQEKISSKEAMEHISVPCELALSVLKESGQQFFKDVAAA